MRKIYQRAPGAGGATASSPISHMSMTKSISEEPEGSSSAAPSSSEARGTDNEGRKGKPHESRTAYGEAADEEVWESIDLATLAAERPGFGAR